MRVEEAVAAALSTVRREAQMHPLLRSVPKRSHLPKTYPLGPSQEEDVKGQRLGKH